MKTNWEFISSQQNIYIYIYIYIYKERKPTLLKVQYNITARIIITKKKKTLENNLTCEVNSDIGQSTKDSVYDRQEDLPNKVPQHQIFYTYWLYLVC